MGEEKEEGGRRGEKTTRGEGYDSVLQALYEQVRISPARGVVHRMLFARRKNHPTISTTANITRKKFCPPPPPAPSSFFHYSYYCYYDDADDDGEDDDEVDDDDDGDDSRGRVRIRIAGLVRT